MMPGREIVQVRNVAGRDRPDPAERLAEDHQPQDRLDRAGDELGPVVAQFLQLDQANVPIRGQPRTAARGAGLSPCRAGSLHDGRATDIAQAPLLGSGETLAGVVAEHVLEAGFGSEPSALSSSGLPIARSRPWCIRATRSQSTSASSM